MEIKRSLRALPYNAIARKFAFLFMILLCFYFPTKSEAALSWSDSPKSITDSEFKEIIEQYTDYDVSGEDFTTYTGNYKYNNVLNAIFKDTYHKAFFDMGDNKVGIRYKTSAWTLSLSGQKYNLDYLITLVFDFQNKTLKYQSIDTNTTYFADKGWVIELEDVTTIDWQSEAYQSNLIYDSFFLVLGEFYGTEGSLLNYIWDYEINSTTYEGIVYSGNILISEENESWLTTNLTESFLSGDYEYYVEFYAYDSSRVARNFTRKEYVKSVNFTNTSVYQPTFEEVNTAIKKDTNYQDYVYTLALYKPDGNTEKTLIVSDLFIVNNQPLAEIEYFVLKYEYINYGEYIGIGGNTGGSGEGGNNDLTETNGLLNDVNAGITDLNNNLTSVPDLSGEIITSGEITESLGFEVAADPYDNFWYEITTGLGTALTQNKRSVSVNFRNKTYTINLDDFAIQIPRAISGFTETLCIVFISWIMLKYIKISVDMIASGNIDTLLQMNEEEGIVDLF